MCECVFELSTCESAAFSVFAIHSILPPSTPHPLPGALFRSVPTFAALCLSLPLPSVHCFGLQLLYLLRLTAGLALPLGFRMGNVLAERGREGEGVDNRSRRGALISNAAPPPHPHPKYSGAARRRCANAKTKKTNRNMFISLRFPLYLLRLPSAGIPCHSSLRLISSPSLLTAALSDLAGGGAVGGRRGR